MSAWIQQVVFLLIALGILGFGLWSRRTSYGPRKGANRIIAVGILLLVVSVVQFVLLLRDLSTS